MFRSDLSVRRVHLLPPVHVHGPYEETMPTPHLCSLLFRRSGVHGDRICHLYCQVEREAQLRRWLVHGSRHGRMRFNRPRQPHGSYRTVPLTFLPSNRLDHGVLDMTPG